MIDALLFLFRSLLRILPTDLRTDHGAEMVEAFRARVDEARHAGIGSALAEAFGAMADLIRRAGYEHWLRRDRAGRRKGRLAMLPTDLRFAVRGFVRQPASTGLLAVTLTLAMASAMAVFGLVDGLIFRPLPFPRSDRLVYLNETAPRWNLTYTGINYPDFVQWRAANRAFESMAVLSGAGFNLADAGGTERVLGAEVSHDLATVLGLQPLVGRAFTAEDDRPGAPNVVMIGEAMWRTRFGGRPDVVGDTLRLNGEPHTIVGVLPRAATFPRDYVLWRPLRAEPVSASESYSYDGIGRLKPGVSIAAAREDLLQAHRPIWAATDTARTVSPVAVPLREYLSADFEVLTSALVIGVALMLLCACANVASSMLARAIFRQRDVALRVAVGADPGQVARQMMVESLVLAGVAGVAGSLLGYWALGLFAGALPDQLPRWLDLTPRWSSAVVAMMVVAVTAVAFGLAPSIQARRLDPKTALGGAGGRASLSVPQRRLLNGFVVAEVVVAVVLMVSGGLLFRAYQRVRAVDPGFDVSRVLTFRIAPPAVRYPDSTSLWTFRQRLLAELAAVPGVESAGLISCPPLGCHQGNFFEAEGAPPRPSGAATPVTLTLFASSGAFRALDIRLVRGRLLEPADAEPGAPRVVVASEQFAQTNWPGLADPVGRRVRYSGGDSTAWSTVVGVVADVRHYGLDRPTRPTLYYPVTPGSDEVARGLAVVLETQGAGLPIESVRRVVAGLDPELPLFSIGTMEEQLGRSLGIWRVLAAVLAMFAGMSLVLSVGGIYAVLSYLVGRRRAELGVRLALGARPGQVVGLVVRQGLGLIGLGFVIGLPAAALLGRGLAAKVVGLDPWDPIVWVLAVGSIIVTGMAAAAIPGRRAAAIDPRTTLVGE